MLEYRLVYILLICLFSLSTINNLWIKRKIIYPTVVTKGDRYIMPIIILVFIFLALKLTRGSLISLLLILSAALSVLSVRGTLGLSEEGIHYPVYWRFIHSRFTDWKEVVDYSFNRSTGELETVELRNWTLLPYHRYPLDRLREIENFMEKKIKL